MHAHAAERDAHARLERSKRWRRERSSRPTGIERVTVLLQADDRFVLLDDALALNGHAGIAFAFVVWLAATRAPVRAALAACALDRHTVFTANAVVLERLGVFAREARDRTERTRLESRNDRRRHTRWSVGHVVGDALRLALPRIVHAIESHCRLGTQRVDRGECRCAVARFCPVDSADRGRMLRGYRLRGLDRGCLRLRLADDVVRPTSTAP